MSKRDWLALMGGALVGTTCTALGFPPVWIVIMGLVFFGLFMSVDWGD